MSARMYPAKPKICTKNSLEELMFDALAGLPDEYYVFHSFTIYKMVDDVVYESEADFVIFNREKGLLCIEAKAGQVNYSEGAWRYGDNTLMSHDGPYAQAKSNKWKIFKYMEEHGFSYLAEKCKKFHAVWFPSISKEKFKGMRLPSEADINLTLTSEAFDDITGAIEKIFSYDLADGTIQNMEKHDEKIFIERVLAPTLNLVSVGDIEKTHTKMVFLSLLKEQVNLLNYLEEQKTAVINGMAGTGKTIMAVTKAKRHADRGDKVLFLCYNKFLIEDLRLKYTHENIDFYTIDAFACKHCNTIEADYSRLETVLYDMFENHKFPYKHVVVDEGQDFGKAGIHEANIVDTLLLGITENEEDSGTFYMFYDKNQRVQSYRTPSIIDDADCRLTLYKNCRNTRNIARTSLRLLGSKKNPNLFQGAVEGASPEMYFAKDTKDTIEQLNKAINSVYDSGYTDIKILTCKTEEKSIIASECSTGVYMYKGKKIPFTTCRKFKGLEADAIILVDIDKNMFTEEGEQLMYVGSSRAKVKLIMITNMSAADCTEILAKEDGDVRVGKNPEKTFATKCNAKLR